VPAEVVDVCVVGSGAAGGVMAKELSEAGLSVVVLERGADRRARDFSEDELKWPVRDAWRDGHVETYRSDPQTDAAPGVYTRVVCTLGGAQTCWGASCLRLREDEFKVLSREGQVPGANLADWPIEYSEMEPCYEKCEGALGVAGDAGSDPFTPLRRSYPLPPHPSKCEGELFCKGAEALGLHPFSTPRAINSRPYDGRPACNYCGACASFGCLINARGGSLVSMIQKAEETGKCEVRPNCMAREITVDADGKVKGVMYYDAEGAEREQLARVVVLCANGLFSPMLLLSSASSLFPNGLANGSGLVGRNLMLHRFPTVCAVFSTETHSWAQHESDASLNDYRASDAGRGCIRGGVVQTVNFLTHQPIRYAKGFVAAAEGHLVWGQKLREAMSKWPRSMAVWAVVEDLPQVDNRVDQDPVAKDRWGMPAVRITYREHANDGALSQFFAARMKEILEAAKAEQVFQAGLAGPWAIGGREPISGSMHFLGTCRMGADPSSSVLDRFCRAHEVPNLFVVDGSCFPTSGGVPPTLTITANAFRVAEYIVQEGKKGNL